MSPQLPGCGMMECFPTDLVIGDQRATDATAQWVRFFYRLARVTKSSGLHQFLSICSPYTWFFFLQLPVLIKPKLQSPLQVSNLLAFLCHKNLEPDYQKQEVSAMTHSLLHIHTHLPYYLIIILLHSTITKNRILQSYWMYGRSKNGALTQIFYIVKMD